MKNNKLFSTSSLKIIAIISMFIDHFAASDVLKMIIDNDLYYILSRIIGRLAFPIFSFLIATGFYYTKKPLIYLIRLGIFAVLSEIPFDLAFSNKSFDFSHQNVFFTLALGLFAIILYDYFREKDYAVSIFSLFLMALIAYFLKTDYGAIGVLMIFSFYYFRKSKLWMFISVFLLNLALGIIQIFAVFSLLFIFNYNHKKGINLKYFFYVFYPLHLLLLYYIKYIYG